MALASRAAAAVACVLLALAASAAGAGSHSPAPAPAVDCVSQAATLFDCLDYVQQGSTARRPSAACCGEVKTAVASPVIVGCLCSLAGSKNLGFPIDIKRVLALPGACGASNAAFSKCNSEHRPSLPSSLLLSELVSSLNLVISHHVYKKLSTMPSPPKFSLPSSRIHA